MFSRNRYIDRAWHNRMDQELTLGMHNRPSLSYALLILEQAAHDYARSSGDDKYRSVNLVNQIHHNLYTPSTWATFASGDFYSFYQGLVQATGTDIPLATRSLWTPPELKRQSGQDWPDYTFQAISCGDSIDESDITSRAVFDELIRVVKDVSPMCKSPCFHQLHLSHVMSSRRSIPSAWSLLPPMARSCYRKVHRSMEQHLEEPHHHNRKQG